MNAKHFIATAGLLLALSAFPTAAQYKIAWFTIDGGGTMSATFGDVHLSGTLGQWDASVTLSGGEYQLAGGFWAAISSGPSVCPGDCNCDGQVDFADINPFVTALLNGVYCDGTGDNADVSGNGTTGFDDINPFVALLTQHMLPIECP